MKWETSSGLTEEKLDEEDDEVVECALLEGAVTAAQYRGSWVELLVDEGTNNERDLARRRRRAPAGRVGADMMIGYRRDGGGWRVVVQMVMSSSAARL